jgi:hypothetical protein
MPGPIRRPIGQKWADRVLNTDAEPYPHRAVHARVTREILRADQLGLRL